MRTSCLFVGIPQCFDLNNRNSTDQEATGLQLETLQGATLGMIESGLRDRPGS